MRILFCAWRDIANPRAGGSEVLVDRLAAGLTELGHDVTLLCAGPVGDHPYRVVANGGRLTQFLRAPWMVRRHIGPVDLIVDVANGTGFYPVLWSRRPRICLVNHVHTEQWNDWFPQPFAACGRELERRLLPLLNRRNPVVAVSPSTAGALIAIGVPRDNVVVVPNGVDLVVDRAEEAAEPLFLAVGRLVPQKRYDLLLEMWEDVRPVTGGRLVVVGDGPQRAALESAQGMGVEILGEVSDVERDQLYDQAWALLHPAEVEGWGLVVTEAAARGRPTVAFDVPGLRDSVIHGVTGLLATNRHEFVANWRAVGTDADLRHRLGVAACERSREFPWSRTVDSFESVATTAIGGTTLG